MTGSSSIRGQIFIFHPAGILSVYKGMRLTPDRRERGRAESWDISTLNMFYVEGLAPLFVS